VNRNKNTISKFKRILRWLGGGDEAYYTYVEEADNPGLRRGQAVPTKIALNRKRIPVREAHNK
jgi:hypothetical protein